jgi:hypothetical protein
MINGIRWFPIVPPSYENVDGILANIHARKNEERWDEYNKQLVEKIHLRDYLYDLYLKRTHENHIRMEIFKVSTVDFFV